MFDKAKNALIHLTARYQGESGFPAKDYPVLQSCVTSIVEALDAGRAAHEELSKLKSQTD